MLPLILVTLVKIGLLVAGLMTAAAYLVLVERRVAAWVQDRLGPNRVGIPLTKVRLFGLGQPIADGVKSSSRTSLPPAASIRRCTSSPRWCCSRPRLPCLQ